jgi:hypothetical protein
MTMSTITDGDKKTHVLNSTLGGIHTHDPTLCGLRFHMPLSWLLELTSEMYFSTNVEFMEIII